jgi:hypothetical protein
MPIEMFDDVFKEKSKLIERQKSEFLKHIEAYKDQYPMNSYEKL